MKELFAAPDLTDYHTLANKPKIAHISALETRGCKNCCRHCPDVRQFAAGCGMLRRFAYFLRPPTNAAPIIETAAAFWLNCRYRDA
jgi:hypothetical protein